MIVSAFIEMQSGSNYKYEFDKYTGELTLDRVLNHIIPANYGFIPETLCEDGDALDIFILSTKPITQGARVKASILGGLICRDNGYSDDKLIAILEGESISPEQYNLCLAGIQTYLENYKKGFVIEGVVNASQAAYILSEAKTLYLVGDDNVGFDNEPDGLS